MGTKTFKRTNSGDFGYAGNIFTNGRFIAYVTDLKPKSFKGLESYNMFYRCFGFINKDGEMVGNIWYPIKTYMAFQDEHFKCVTDVSNKDAKYKIDKVFNEYDFFIYPYLDYSVLDTDSGNYYFSDSYLRFHPIIEFKDGTIKQYSSKIKYEGSDFDGDNIKDMFWRYCDVCKTWHGNIETIGDYNYCPDCAKKAIIKCDHCGKEIKLLDAHFTEDNKWICDDCIKVIYGRTDVKTCSCGTLIRMKCRTQCKYCRSEKTDAFKNEEFEYIKPIQEPMNVYSYFRHAYVPNNEGGYIPPHLRFDEDIFSETEKYVFYK